MSFAVLFHRFVTIAITCSEINNLLIIRLKTQIRIIHRASATIEDGVRNETNISGYCFANCCNKLTRL